MFPKSAGPTAFGFLTETKQYGLSKDTGEGGPVRKAGPGAKLLILFSLPGLLGVKFDPV
jgi:hypothetical protein